MNQQFDLSREAILRLPVYFRYLREWMVQGKEKISSEEFASVMGVTSSQVRRDMSCFGISGQKGYGYTCRHLHDTIARLLGIFGEQSVIIIGAGNLGHALAYHRMFEGRGYRLTAVFDNDPAIIGSEINRHTVRAMETLPAFCRNRLPEIAVLAVPSHCAPEIADQLSDLGVPGILNFSHADLTPKKHTLIENVHLSDSLMVLSYRIQYER